MFPYFVGGGRMEKPQRSIHRGACAASQRQNVLLVQATCKCDPSRQIWRSASRRRRLVDDATNGFCRTTEGIATRAGTYRRAWDSVSQGRTQHPYAAHRGFVRGSATRASFLGRRGVLHRMDRTEKAKGTFQGRRFLRLTSSHHFFLRSIDKTTANTKAP